MQYQFHGVLSPTDAKRHIGYEFDVPTGTGLLTIEMHHTEGQLDGLSNMLTLSLFDAQGHRGAGHRMGRPEHNQRVHRIEITYRQATPGYLPGLTPGRWQIVVDTHRVTDAQPCTYSIAIQCQPHPNTATLADSASPNPPQRGPGWYRGDLHGHTVHSDGSWQVADLVAAAKHLKLDFVTLSDHNTISPLAEMDRYSSPDLLTMGGLELTTFWGHALALGVRDWVDWRVRPDPARSMPMIAEEVMRAGGTYIIAHPMAIGDPICTGCSWVYADMRPGPARIVEIWNSGDWDNESFNEQGLALYYSWLNQGLRLAATAGTDVHGPYRAGMPLGFNVVYAEALSEAAILQAIRAGHLFVSSGPHVELTARSSQGHTAMMGDLLPQVPATIKATWRAAEAGMSLRVIVDGSCVHQQVIQTEGQYEWQTDGQIRWCNIELRDPQGHAAAIANPIFFGMRNI